VEHGNVDSVSIVRVADPAAVQARPVAEAAPAGLHSRHSPDDNSRRDMAKNSTFDITSSVDMQEVDNAVNQARKEVQQRYDFKGATAEIDFDRKEGTLKLLADDDYKLKALVDVIQGKLIRRGVPIRNLDYGEVEQAFGGKVRQTITLVQSISTEKAKEIVRAIKDGGFKKVNAQIQDEQVRVSSPSIDELQAVIAHLKKQDFGLELSFGNFRSQ
jgi:cyclic-di-GMP-binding protein